MCTESAAAKHLAAELGVDVESLKKGARAHLRKDKALAHFCMVMKIYASLPFPARVPGDLSDSVRHARGDKRMTAPCFGLLLCLKYGPYRDVAREVVKAQKATNIDETLLRAILEGAAAISPQALAPWRQCCGRHVAHHHGFLPLMMDMGCLHKTKTLKRGKDRARTQTTHLAVSMWLACSFAVQCLRRTCSL